ncbi:hypothetical protein RHOW815_000269 [Candidatus Rhabdochlamydia sp. W815]|nr:hypothetical protein RHOW815_000269 [Candidatus Rhabdochlamydia sp. W815]
MKILENIRYNKFDFHSKSLVEMQKSDFAISEKPHFSIYSKALILKLCEYVIV